MVETIGTLLLGLAVAVASGGAIYFLWRRVTGGP